MMNEKLNAIQSQRQLESELYLHFENDYNRQQPQLASDYRIFLSILWAAVLASFVLSAMTTIPSIKDVIARAEIIGQVPADDIMGLVSGLIEWFINDVLLFVVTWFLVRLV